MSPFDELAAKLDQLPEAERRRIGAQAVNERLVKALLAAVKTGRLTTIIDLTSPQHTLQLLDVLGPEIYAIVEETMGTLTARSRTAFAQPNPGPTRMADGG